MLHLHQYILNLLHFLYSITYGWNLEIGRVYFQRFRCACLTVFLFSLLGWSQLSWTAFSSSSSEIDWVLPWRWTSPSRLRIYATWKLGKPFVQEWVFFLSHLLTVLINLGSLYNTGNMYGCNRRLIFSTTFLEPTFEGSSWCCQRACISPQCRSKSDI